jgi:hypothetical protein
VRNRGEVVTTALDGSGAAAWAACRHDALRRGFTLLKAGGLEALHRASQPTGRYFDLRERAPWMTSQSTFVLFANGADLWPRFRDSIAEGSLDARTIAEDRVFDSWIEAELRAVTAASGRRHATWFSHDADLDFVQLAVDVGLASRAPCRLAIHPRRGLWFALRGFAVLDLDHRDVAELGSAHGEGAMASNTPCAGCPAPCVPPFEIARARMQAGDDPAVVAELWLAVRDACPLGREHRYGDEQLAFHMGIERAALLHEWSAPVAP